MVLARVMVLAWGAQRTKSSRPKSSPRGSQLGPQTSSVLYLLNYFFNFHILINNDISISRLRVAISGEIL